MRVIKADIPGFCFGVRRAVKMIETELEQSGPLCTLGAIVHNAQVVESLAEKGSRLVHSLDDVQATEMVAITAHGAGEEVYEEIRSRQLGLVDTTCPIVRKAQQTAADMVEHGFSVVLYGEEDHPEVRGILSWTRGQGVATMRSDADIAQGERGIGIISQTTKKKELFADFARDIAGRFAGEVPEIRIIDTTCPETGRRYEAAQDLAKQVNAIVVVGSRTSANTRKLAETCRATGVPTYHIERADEIEESWLSEVRCFGVTAGASTPDQAIERVTEELERYENADTVHNEGGLGASTIARNQ